MEASILTFSTTSLFLVCLVGEFVVSTVTISGLTAVASDSGLLVSRYGEGAESMEAKNSG